NSATGDFATAAQGTLASTAVQGTPWTSVGYWYASNHPATVIGYGLPAYPTTLPASDVYTWAKASTKPTYSTSEVSEGTRLYYTDARVSANSTVAANTAKTSFPGFTSLFADYGFTDNSSQWNTAYNKAHFFLTLFGSNGLSLDAPNQILSMGLASTSTTGALSSTNWNTFNGKQNAITGAATTIASSDLVASRALISDASGKVGISAVTSSQLTYLSGVTDYIQDQLNNKAYINGNTVTAFRCLNLDISNTGWNINGTTSRLAFYFGGDKATLSTTGILTVASTMTATNFILSDRRLKENIKPINFKNLDKIKWVSFNMKSDSSKHLRNGVIAQDLEKILPQFVTTANDSMKTKAVNYTDLLIAKVAQMDSIINSLQNRIKTLENAKN
ncbi:MAG: tail fiber domain-containing protein, partial [Peptostreptococcaceae bacterium]|nr:tail fiber domain-containing protein [Peptostreptococcaceae bacterium]